MQQSSLDESFLDDLNELDAESGSGSEEDELDANIETAIESKEDDDSWYHLSLSDICKLRNNVDFCSFMESISVMQVKVYSQQLIVNTNKYLLDIEQESTKIYKYVAKLYSKKFPELESIATNKVDFAKLVIRISNETDMSLIDLSGICTSAQAMVINLTAGAGIKFTESDIHQLHDCLLGSNEIIHLDTQKQHLLQYLEACMSKLCPNMSVIVGSRIASILIGMAGGLEEFCRIPSCNIQVMGSTTSGSSSSRSDVFLGGFSLNPFGQIGSRGIIGLCDLVTRIPPKLRQKACRLISAKVALAARVDRVSSSSSSSSSCGLKMLSHIQSKLTTWQEPPKSLSTKPLKPPDDKPGRRRGGERYRRMKQRLGLTDTRKLANRRTFADCDLKDYADDAMGHDLGLYGSSNSGAIRVFKRSVDSDFVKPIVKKPRSVCGLTSVISGFKGQETSVAMTPFQGMELVNPDVANRTTNGSESKWFSSQSGFLSAAPR